MKRLIAAPLFVCAALPLSASDNAKAEAAVLERAKQYYELMTTGKFRASEAYVCEAGLDAYFQQGKHVLPSAKVQGAKVAADGKSADVSVVIEEDISFAMTTKRMPIPQNSHWLYEKKRWCLDVAPGIEVVQTPFGKLPMRTGLGAANASAETPKTPAPTVNVAALTNRVEISKDHVTLLPDEDGTDTITITNGLPGLIKVEVLCWPLEGLSCKLSESELGPNKKAELTVSFKHSGKDIPSNADVVIAVSPFGSEKVLPIRPR